MKAPLGERIAPARTSDFLPSTVTLQKRSKKDEPLFWICVHIAAPGLRRDSWKLMTSPVWSRSSIRTRRA